MLIWGNLVLIDDICTKRIAMKVVSLKSFRVSLVWMNYNVILHKISGITTVPLSHCTEAYNDYTEYYK